MSDLPEGVPMGEIPMAPTPERVETHISEPIPMDAMDAPVAPE